MPIPVSWGADYLVEDFNGDRALVRINMHIADVTTVAAAVSAFWAHVATVGADIAALTNAKVVRTGFSLFGLVAQGPAAEAGKYETVQSKAKLNFGDGTGLRSQLVVPAPVDALFLASPGQNLKIVNPGIALPNAGLIATLQTDAAALGVSPSGGAIMSQFFGGQLVTGKPRRRVRLPQP